MTFGHGQETQLNNYAFKATLFVTAILACVTVSADGGSRGFVEDRTDRIGIAIQQSIENGEIAGAVAYVARDGQTLLH